MTVAMKSGRRGEKSSSNADINPAAHGFELPADFQIPTAEEIEHDLALGEPGWISLLITPARESTQTVSWLRGVRAGSWRALAFGCWGVGCEPPSSAAWRCAVRTGYPT
jgi:hypothetical protein